MLDLAWQDGAACKGEDVQLFYLDADDYPEEIARLKNLCESCPVLAKCQVYALEWESYGFWGGMTVSERRRVRKQFGITKRSIRSAHLTLLKGDVNEPRNQLERARRT